MSYQKKIARFFLPELAIAIALAFLLLVRPAYAEGELPPAEPEPAATEPQPADPPPAEEPVLSEPEPLPVEAVTEEPLLPEEPVDATSPDAQEPAATVEEAPVLSTETQPDPAESLTAEPLLTDVAAALEEEGLQLADGEGDPLPLASVETAEMLSTSDPYFKVGLVTYRFLAGVGACASYPLDICADGLAMPITSALTYIQTNGTIPSDGKIYVESGLYTESVTINGANPNMSTLKGLIGVDGSAVTTISGVVSISNLTTGFTLSGFTINNRLIIDSNTGTLNLVDLDVNYTATVNYPISVTNHNGSVIVKQVKSSGNRYSNLINNTAGTGNITILQSAFDNNNPASPGSYAYGLHLYSKGTITLDGVSASHNNGNGIFVAQGGALTIKNSVFSNNYATPDNFLGGYGVYAEVSKAITISQVIANNNEQAGLYLFTPMAVTLTDVSANYNLKNGVQIEAASGFGAVKVSYSAFKDNDNNGLLIEAKGPVTLTSIFASLNTFSGVVVDNCQWNGGTSACDGTGSVIVTSVAAKGSSFANAFLNNSQLGLSINSKANILVENFTASGNMGGHALFLTNSDGSGSVTVKTTLPGWMNTIDGNTNGNGLYISSKGAISVSNVLSSDNGQSGFQLSNNAAPAMLPITVTNSIASGNGYFGLNLYTRGLATFNNVDAFDHVTAGYDGAIIDTTAGTGGVTIKAPAGQVNEFYNNDYRGINISTYGVVSISDVKSYSNGTYGVYIYSSPAIGTPAVSLTRVTTTGNVLNSGLYISALGPISLTNVTSSDNNNGYGADINNASSLGVPGVSVRNSVFNNNKYDGLSISSKGAVYLSVITANDNLFSGLNVDNCSWNGSACAGVGSITLTAPAKSENKFIGNTFNGLGIYSFGTITIVNTRAESNGTTGWFVSNNYPNSIGNIIVTASSGQFNYSRFNGQTSAGNGISLNSFGVVSVSRVIVEMNNGYGMQISNDGALTPKAATVADSTFNGNEGTGLTVYSLGLVTLRGVVSTNNSMNYAAIPLAGRTVHDFLSESFAQDIWTFSGTVLDPIDIILESDAFDAYLELRDIDGNLIYSDDNTFGGTDARITNSLPFTGSFYIMVRSTSGDAFGKYTLALNDSTHVSNTYYSHYGAYVDNSLGSAGVSILPGAGSAANNFSLNSYYGLQVATKGAIILNKVSGDKNGYGGGYLNNSTVQNMPVSLTASNFNDNDNFGMYVTTSGNIVWNGGGASGNATTGANLDGTTALAMNSASFSNASFNNNKASNGGLQAIVYGNITLLNVNASGNAGGSAYGVLVDNCQWSGSACNGIGNVTVSSTTSAKFNANGYLGLQINTGGIVRLVNVSANDNGNTGIRVDASYGSGTVTILNPAITYNNTLSNNTSYGLFVNANGAITINQLIASGNALNNLHLITYTTLTPAAISLTNITANDSTTQYGIFAQSAGAITLNRVTAIGNTGIGTYLEGGTGMNVMILSSRFNSNGSRGLEVNSSGKITLNAVWANDNGSDGAYLDNDLGSGDVEILATLGDNQFSFNTLNGLTIATVGNVKLNKITAQENGGRGVTFSNNGGTGTVTITTLLTKMNGSYGLYFFTSGAATLTNVTSLSNGVGTNADGMYVNSTSAAGVTIVNSFFLGNEGSGIEADLNAANLLTLVNTAFWGNDSNSSGDPDKSVY